MHRHEHPLLKQQLSSAGQQLIQLLPPELLRAPAEGQSPLSCCHHLCWFLCRVPVCELCPHAAAGRARKKKPHVQHQTQGQGVAMQKQRQGSIPCLTLNKRRSLIQWPLTATQRAQQLLSCTKPSVKGKEQDASVCQELSTAAAEM